jgi:hypothetical protein
MHPPVSELLANPKPRTLHRKAQNLFLFVFFTPLIHKTRL